MEDKPGTVYRSRGRNPLTPQDIHQKRFNRTRVGRRGLAPGEVHQFLELVEVDLAVLYQELSAARDEADRLKEALREWQTDHLDCYLRSRQDGHQHYRWPTSGNQTVAPRWEGRGG